MPQAVKKSVAKKEQRTVQMFDFAVAARDAIVKARRENETVVASAAVLAFAKLPVGEQLAHIAETRQQHATASRG